MLLFLRKLDLFLKHRSKAAHLLVTNVSKFCRNNVTHFRDDGHKIVLILLGVHYPTEGLDQPCTLDWVTKADKSGDGAVDQ